MPPPLQPPETESVKQYSLTQRTLSGFAWMFSGSMAGAGLQLVVTMILARLLSPADFGLISAALVIIYFSEIFSSLGMGPALMQRKELEPRHISTGFTVNFFFTLLLAVLIYLTAPAIAAFYRLPALVPILQVLAIIFPIRGMAMLSEALLKRAGHFRQLATLDLISYVLGYALVGVGVAWMGFGVWALVVATIMQATLNSLLLFWRVPHSIRPRFDRSAFQDLMGFGGGITVANIANYFARQGDNLVVGRWLGAEALGFYGKAFSLMTLPTKQFSKVMDSVLFPVLSQVQDDRQRLAIGYQRGISVIALVVLPVSCFAIILAPEMIRVVYGPGWEPVIVPFQILCLSMFFRSAYKISASINKACGAVYSHASIQIIYGALVVGGAIMTQRWGLAGVAISSAIAIGVNYGLLSRISLHLANKSWREFGRWHIPGLLISALMLIEVGVMATILRILTTPPLIILLITTFISGIFLLLLLRFLPILWGEPGLWLRTSLTRFWHQWIMLKRPLLKFSMRRAK